MGFVEIGFLGALAALAVPIIVHLVLGRRARRVDLGTLRFLSLALRENVRRRRLKRWLLLALRMAGVALLALLFARPYLAAYHPRHADRLVVILLDRSASMGLTGQRGRPLDLAAARIRGIVAQCGVATEVHAACFDHAVHPLVGGDGRDSGRAASPAHLATSLAKLDGLKAVCGSTDYGAAMAWARDVCVASRRSCKELYILTDLQRSGLDRTESEPFPKDVAAHLIDVGQAYPENAAVTRIAPHKTRVRPGESLTISATVFNAGPFPLKGAPVVLRFSSGTDRQVVRSTIDLDGGASAPVQLEVAGLKEGMWRGELEIEVEDALPFDNVRYAAVKVAPPLRVALVAGQAGSSPYASETYFLETALRLAVPGEVNLDSPFEPKAMAAAENGSLPNLSETQLVVLANVARVSSADAARLAEFVGGGGGLLVFTGDNVEADGYSALAAAGLGPGQIAGPAHATAVPWRLESWDPEHLVFRPFNDPEYGDLRQFAFRAITEVEPAPGAAVLARFRGGRPAVIERRCGRGKSLWFLSACDREWGDWCRSRLYLPLVHQMLAYLAGLAGGGPVRELITDEVGEGGDDPPVAGVYDRGSYHEVMNVNPRESETDRCTREEFAARFQLQLQEGDETEVGDSRTKLAASVDLRPDEIWHWLLLCLLLVLVLENFLANRTAA